jgi:hypothetical protein
VAHTCNPSYLGGRDQEDQGSKTAGQIVLRPYLKKKKTTKKHHKYMIDKIEVQIEKIES